MSFKKGQFAVYEGMFCQIVEVSGDIAFTKIFSNRVWIDQNLRLSRCTNVVNKDALERALSTHPMITGALGQHITIMRGKNKGKPSQNPIDRVPNVVYGVVGESTIIKLKTTGDNFVTVYLDGDWAEISPSPETTVSWLDGFPVITSGAEVYYMGEKYTTREWRNRKKA